jgi:hypothetical protein
MQLDRAGGSLRRLRSDRSVLRQLRRVLTDEIQTAIEFHVNQTARSKCDEAYLL